MKNSKQKSLKFKLIALSLGITLSLGIASVSILQYLVHEQESDYMSSYGALASNVSDALAAQFYERYGDVQAFAINPKLQSSSKKSIVETLNAYSALYGIYDLIMVIDAKGRLIAVNDKDPAGKDLSTKSLYEKNYSESEWFKNTMTGKTTDDKEKAFSGTYFEDVNVDPLTTEVFGSKRLGNSFNTVIKNDAGTIIGMVSNRAGSRWFEVAFKEAYAAQEKTGNPSADFSLVNKDGFLAFEYGEKVREKNGDAKYNFDELLKYNFQNSGHPFVTEMLKTKKTVTGIYHDPKHAETQLQGVDVVEGPKFVTSIGWGVIASDSRDEVMRSLDKGTHMFYLVFALVMFASIVFSFWFSNGLAKRLTLLADKLSTGANQVASASTQISASSAQLSEAATEQAAAIQETAASIDEVSAMVKKSAENAAESQKVSEGSRRSSEQGQSSVQQMIESIRNISEGNTNIMNQVEDGNQKISEIVKVISEIENKTKVINDIVFQTKLLSFNASVEAARAGEHGKGFAVVAEEVGNLAQMSGNAAKEISAMLESSIQKVEGIVTETKTKVERLVVESRDRVDSGMKVADQCGEVLKHIQTSVHEVDGMVAEIATASHEQAQGVTEINKAINQLDQVTHQNSSVSQQTASAAKDLNDQSVVLKDMVDELFSIIYGSNEAPVAQTGQKKPAKKQAEVLKFKRKETAPVTVSKSAEPMKKAVGAEGFTTPSNDDPRFEDL